MSHYSYKKVSNDNLSTVREMTNSIVHIDDFFFFIQTFLVIFISLLTILLWLDIYWTYVNF